MKAHPFHFFIFTAALITNSQGWIIYNCSTTVSLRKISSELHNSRAEQEEAGGGRGTGRDEGKGGKKNWEKVGICEKNVAEIHSDEEEERGGRRGQGTRLQLTGR